jgi:hypothetical protein
VRRRVAVAQHRARAARGHRRTPSTFPRQGAVTDRVHAVVLHQQPSDPHAIRDRLLAEADREQLRPDDDAVLPARERRDLMFRVVLGSHMEP